MADCPKCGAELRDPHACKACGWRTRIRPRLDAAPEEIRASCTVCGEGTYMRNVQGTVICESCESKRRAADALETLVRLGLARLPNEPFGAWRKRCLTYMRKGRALKRFGNGDEA